MMGRYAPPRSSHAPHAGGACHPTRRKEHAMTLGYDSARPRRPGVLAWCAVLALVGVLSGRAAAAPARTWIVGATVLSPARQDAGQVLHVRLDGDRITAVTATLPADASQDATVVHAEGRYLIPGLIDAHVHLASVPGLSFPMRAQHPGLGDAYVPHGTRALLPYV